MSLDPPLFEQAMLVIDAPNRPEFGTVLQTWTEYSYEKDLFRPSDTFSFRLAITATSGPNSPTEEYIRQMMALTTPDTVVKVVVGQDTLMTGIIGTQRITGDKKAEYVEISGRDPASLLTDNEVDPKLKITRDTTLPDLADQILQRYRGKGIPLRVISDDRTNRSVITGLVRKPQQTREYVDTSAGRIRVNYDKDTTKASLADQVLGVKLAGQPQNAAPEFFEKVTIADARPHPGETEWDFLDRHAKNLGVIPAMSAEGDLIFLRPDYNQRTLFTLRRRIGQALAQSNNIISGGRELNYENTATMMHILGRGSLYHSERGTKKRRRSTKKKPKIQGTATTALPYTWPRERYIRDSSPLTSADASRVAAREMAHRNSNAEVYTYELPGIGQNGVRFSYDTLAQVIDDLPRPGVNKTCYITKYGVRVALGRDGSVRTSLTLVPKGAIIL